MGEPNKVSLPPLPPALRPSDEEDDGGSTPDDLNLVNQYIDKHADDADEDEDYEREQVRDDLAKTVVGIGSLAEVGPGEHGASASGVEINNLVNYLYIPSWNRISTT